jgi:hypothetical protein
MSYPNICFASSSSLTLLAKSKNKKNSFLFQAPVSENFSPPAEGKTDGMEAFIP